MQKFEDVLNQLSDSNWGWQPFLYLRPGKNQDMSYLRVAVMALHYGPLAGLVLLLPGYLAQGKASLSPQWIAQAMVVGIMSFFLIYRLTFAIAWNRRAGQLRQQSQPTESPAGAEV